MKRLPRLRQWLRRERQALVLRRLAARAAPAPAAGSRIVFLCEEFFHPDLRGFGGFGKTVKNIAQHFNAHTPDELRVALAIPQAMGAVSRPELRCYHDTPVLLRPQASTADAQTFDGYAQLLAGLEPKAFVSIDWYPSYLYPLCASPATPLVIWIHDPRDRAEWLRIAATPGELAFRNLGSAAELAALADEKAAAMRHLHALARREPRRIVFATTARSLVPLARSTYRLPELRAHWLPNPIELPAPDGAVLSERPSLLFLGRLDPVKRPWIAFALARRHPDVDFLIAGQSHEPGLLAPWLERYPPVPNLKLLGHVEDADKDRLLRSCWALLNTSVHEAEPVSFLEALSYAKPVISCHDPDGAVTRFGYPVGEVPGDGLDGDSLARFSAQIERLMADEPERRRKGIEGMLDTRRHHSFESFRSHLAALFEVERIA